MTPIIFWWLGIYVLWLKASPAESESWSAEIPHTVFGLEGSCVVIPCQFRYPGSGHKASHFTGIWSKDSNEIVYHTVHSEISSAYKQRTSLWGDLSHQNCSLKINRLRHNDHGPFMFRIEIEDFNKYSFAHSKVSITMKAADKPELSIPEEMSSGKRVSTTCSVIHSCPSNPPNITWSHKGAVSSHSQQQTNGQYKITSSLSFTPSKTDHDKALSCTAVFQGDARVSSAKILKVKYAPENVEVISKDSVTEGGTVNMTCSSDSNPASHTYHWFDQAGTLLSDGHILTLKNVSRHIGTIYCSAINTEGQTNSRPIQPNVLYPPEINTGSACTVDPSKVTCLCIIDSHPASEIKLWGTDPSTELRKAHQEKHGSLTIVTLQGALGFSDTVHCQAINSQGNYTMTIQVPHRHETNISMLHVSIAAAAGLALIICFTVCIIKRRCRKNEPTVTPQPKTEMNVTSQKEPESKFKDVSSCYDGSQHVYGNMANLEEPYEEQEPYDYAADYEETYANV